MTKIFDNNQSQIIKAGLIGNPVNHSLSPKIHNYFLQKLQINGSYQAFNIDPKNFYVSLENLKNQGFAGFNVTIPFKEKIIEQCFKLDDSAQKIKAVNTVVIDHNSNFIGYNSDAKGFIDNIFAKYPNYNLRNKNAFVIGAGGASRAIVYGLLTSNVQNIFITNRNHHRVENLIADFSALASQKKINLKYFSLEDFTDHLNHCDILINSTSLGMQNQPPLLLNLEKLNYNSLVYDIVYKPLITDLLYQAQKRGNPIITGLGMLIRQALVGFNLWYHKSITDIGNLEELLISNKI